MKFVSVLAIFLQITCGLVLKMRSALNAYSHMHLMQSAFSELNHKLFVKKLPGPRQKYVTRSLHLLTYYIYDPMLIMIHREKVFAFSLVWTRPLCLTQFLTFVANFSELVLVWFPFWFGSHYSFNQFISLAVELKFRLTK